MPKAGFGPPFFVPRPLSVSVPSPSARRLLDFLSGAAYAQDGNIKRVAVNTYLITPCNVGLSGDIVDELENNGLYI